MHLGIADPDHTSGQIHGDHAGAKGGAFRPVPNGGGAAESGTDAGEEFSDGEGLAYEIVGARIERLDLVFFLPTRGEDEDRNLTALANGADHFEAIPIRQPQVQQNEIGLARLRLRNAFGRIHGFVAAELLGGQCRAQEPANLGIVLNDKDLKRVRHAESGGEVRDSADRGG